MSLFSVLTELTRVHGSPVFRTLAETVRREGIQWHHFPKEAFTSPTTMQQVVVKDLAVIGQELNLSRDCADKLWQASFVRLRIERKLATGVQTCTVKVQRITSFDVIRSLVTAKLKHPAGTIRLFYNGNELPANGSPSTFEMDNGTRIRAWKTYMLDFVPYQDGKRLMTVVSDATPLGKAMNVYANKTNKHGTLFFLGSRLLETSDTLGSLGVNSRDQNKITIHCKHRATFEPPAP